MGAQEQLTALRHQLTSIMTAKRMLMPDQVKFQEEEGRRFFDLYDLVLTLGEEFVGAPRPDWCEQMSMQQCYANCDELTWDAENLTYCEGWGWKKGILLPVCHAWLVNQDGEVIDPTWDDPEDAVYIGLRLPDEVRLESNRRSGFNAVLDSDWMADGWFLREGYKLLGVSTDA